MPDVEFWKLCGSGIGEGFTPKPNTAVWAILAVWPNEKSARTAITEAAVYRRWRRRASESWTVFLSTQSARGVWSGKSPFTASEARQDGPMAVLTRATIKPTSLRHFWGQEPAISAAIGKNRDVLFKIGIGEVPLLHQVTFSIWPDARTMADFARGDGPHAEAIRQVRAGGWFREELYARFHVLGSAGTWSGADPLAQPERTAA